MNRANILDEQFHTVVRHAAYPTSWIKRGYLSVEQLKHLLSVQSLSRHFDLMARSLKEDNLCHYTIGSSGHEGNAVLAACLRPTDMAFLHYRSQAFFLARAAQVENFDGVLAQALSLVHASSDPISGGRHKVIGSKELNIPPQTSTIASHLPKALGSAFSIPLAKGSAIETIMPSDSIVVCSFGDASFNHASAQATLNSTRWIHQGGMPIPLLFVCEDNGLGISVKTPQDWIEQSMSTDKTWSYFKADGLDVVETWQVAEQAIAYVRSKRKPAFLHLKTVRLMGHAGSDVEHLYRTVSDIEHSEQDDPLLHTASYCHHHAHMHADEIISIYEKARHHVLENIRVALKSSKLEHAADIMKTLVPPSRKGTNVRPVTSLARKKLLGKESGQLAQPRTMAQLINLTLTDLLIQYPNAVIFGEDVGKKGGVYHVTSKLQERFGPKRVFDTLLDETTILGTAIGLAHNGFLPVPEIQFLAYLHNAVDQLRSEAASLSFFSNGQYTNPMVLRLPGLAYQKGFGGHYHNENTFAAIRDIPGIIIACPSHGLDAVYMLRECFTQADKYQRVVVFLEPIALYNVKDLHAPGDAEYLSDYPTHLEQIPLGDMGLTVQGTNCLIISYGNGAYLSKQAMKVLKEQHQIGCTLLDLRWLAPLNLPEIRKQVANFKQVLIVDECRQTASISEQIISDLALNIDCLPKIERVAADDTFIPIGPAWASVVPSKERIIESVLKLNKVQR